MATGKELGYNTNASAMQMANAIFGDGVTVNSASYSGDGRSSAIYSNGDAVSPDATPGDTGVILSTGHAADFTQRNGDPNRSADTSTDTGGVNNDAQFNQLAGEHTYDASILTVDFTPGSDTLSMQFVFSSEEYPEYVNSIFNDMVGVWVNGQPIDLAVGTGTTSVGNVSPVNNVNLYNDNTGDAYNTEMDGFTVTLTLKMAVIPDRVNTIRIGIADVGDSQYDSNLLIAAGSMQTVLTAQDDALTLAPGATRTVDVLANDSGGAGSTLSITHINGIAVTAGDSVTLGTGQVVTLNADGSFDVHADGDTETIDFTYGVSDGQGHTDTGYVTVTQVPCFVAGTRIRTPAGEVAVERLQPGDLVLTHDHGPQPLRWVGRRRVPAEGALAPVHIRAGTFGPHRALKLSPQHRVLVRDGRAELLFGEAEVLVKAKDLVNGRSVDRIEGGEVDYVHLLFDRHEVVYSEGLATESFLPGPRVTASLERAIVEEICTIFPELDPDTGQGYSPAARRALRTWEAQVLLSNGAGMAQAA